MRKVIAIGESSYNIIFGNNTPQTSFPGGKIINAAASLGATGIPTTVVSECGNDFIGNKIIDYLISNKVETKSIDRFTDGSTALSAIHGDDCVLYGRYPADRFDVVWPRIDEDDIIIVGSFYSIDPDVRVRLAEMLQYATERKAIIVYLPGFHPKMNYRVTKVMTAILENLEMANMVIAFTSDMAPIFKETKHKDIFKKRISFYCPNYIHVDAMGVANLYSTNQSTSFPPTTQADVEHLGWRSGFLAGIIFAIIENDIKFANISTISPDVWQLIMKRAGEFAIEAAKNTENCIPKSFAATCSEELKRTIDSRDNAL